MQVEKGTLVRVHFDSDEQLGNRLIIHKVYFKEGDNEGWLSHSLHVEIWNSLQN